MRSWPRRRKIRELHLSIGACAEDARPDAGGDRVLSRRGRRQAAVRRGVLESRESQDLSVHGCRNRAACGLRKRRQTFSRPTAIICVSRSARRSKTGASTQQSFAFYERGNALKKAECRYRPEPLERNARLQAAVCTREFFAARQGCRLPRPLAHLHRRVAEIGLHSHRADPLPRTPRWREPWSSRTFRGWCRICGGASRPTRPRATRASSPNSARKSSCALGEKYLDDTRLYRKGKPFFIDKMPNNFRHLGLIHLHSAQRQDHRCAPGPASPAASATTSSCSPPDSNSPTASRTSPVIIECMSSSWRIGTRCSRAGYCGSSTRTWSTISRRTCAASSISARLEFEPGCIEFYKTERAVHSASSEQVRRPIYREGVDQWRHYEPWLGPLKEALGPLVKGT